MNAETSRCLTALVAAALLFAGLAGSTTSAAAPSCDALVELAAVRVTAGGERWDSAGALVATGNATTSGLRGSATFADDLRSGRFARRFRIQVMGERADVYDGKTLWAQDISGGVHARDAAFPRRLAVTDAYLARREYLRKSPDARVACAGTVTDRGRALAVVRVTPPGGIPADLGIDPKTKTIARVVERLPITTQITRYADYRRVDGLLLPFAIASGTLLEPDDGYAFSIARYRVTPSPDRGDYAAPVATHPALMRDGKASTTVPMTLDAQQLIVWASIDGRPALPFVLDTGGHAILTTGAAKALGLRGAGAGVSGGAGPGTVPLQYTRVESIRIGAAEIDDQPMLVIPYPYSFYERGRATPLAGILGLEFFERFATRLDYANRLVTLTPLRRFAYRGTGSGVPLRFQDDMPMVAAAADRYAGTFGTDTGNSGSLILFGDFLRRNGFLQRYTGGYVILGHGTGGTNSGKRETLKAFAVGGRELHDVPSYFTQMGSGAFSSWTEAGNIGFDVLSRFIPTFDYANELLYLDPSPKAPALGVNHAGLSVSKNGPNAFDVDLVRPGSAAQASGIVAGERIVAVDGHPASELSRADFVTLVERRPGTSMRLRVQGRSKELTLVLR